MDQLRRKLYDHSETPPERVWQQVESALDQELPMVSRKLSDYSPAPPAGLWNKIRSELEGTREQSKVFPFRKVIRIAAAAVIMFAVFLVVRMFTPESENNQMTSVPKPQLSTPATIDTPDLPVKKDDQDPVPKTDQPVTRSLVKAPIPSALDKTQVPAKKARYTTMSNDEGQTVRLSKKIAPVFDCADAKIKAISARCKEDIRALQEKIAMSLTSPSADFSGLIDLLKSLENEQ